MKECRKRAAGKPKTAQSPRTSEPKVKGKGRGGQVKKGASLDEWPDEQEGQPSGDKSGEEVASLFIGAVDKYGKNNRREGHNRREKYDQSHWQVWERIQEQAPQQWESFKAGNLCVNSVDFEEKGERIDLTIDLGCAACALPVGVASAVGMQELDTAPQEHTAANAKKIWELGLKTPTLRFQNGDVQNLRFSAWTSCTTSWWRRAKLSLQAIELCCNLKTEVVPSSRTCARSAGSESSIETECTCSLVGSSQEIRKNAWHRNGWSSWTSRAQMTGRFYRKPNLSFQNKF